MTSNSENDKLVISEDPSHPANLIPSLSPSGVQKERMIPCDIFVMDKISQKLLRSPNPPIKPSQCTPLFFNSFNKRNATACIHTHSQNAVLVTMLYDKEFTISNQEMIKGIRRDGMGVNLKYFDTLVVPIIDNTAEERDLTSFMAVAMDKYPETCAILVRNHGVYVWADTWERAKTMCECYDYLFELAVKMKSMGLTS
ncbi:Methylthioribulose-1-phosphate dehydratase [Smittium mucronatum]|uniref:Methylthioribulose-1-phosphate dehydratase n=1 Tax=Smittium mucronatum TaxID=133383 RepID=A0A1R0GUR8_9FUNG|nr:Methylthioribulose-1-phosphate dehydratase [Smittium mucronatum]